MEETMVEPISRAALLKSVGPIGATGLRGTDSGVLRRPSSRRDFLLGTVGGASVLALGALPRISVAQTPTTGGVVQIAMSGSNPNNKLDPGLAVGSFERLAQGLLFDNLLGFKQNWEYDLRLAESFEVNKDSTEYVFRLRDGVAFHDGSRLTAEDVAYTVRRVLDSGFGSPALSQLDSWLAADGIEVIDPRTIRFKLLQPDGFFLVRLADRNLRIVKKGWTLSDGDPAGTGPFRVVRFVPGEIFEAERNPEYWDGNKPYLDRVRIVTITEQSTKLQSVLSGESHLADGVVFSNARQVEDSATAQLLRLPNANFAPIAFNRTVEPFTDDRVIWALKIGIDRKRFLNTVLLDFGSIANDVPVPPDDALYPNGLEAVPYDPDGAKALLSAAGHSDLKFTLATSNPEVTMVDSAVVFADLAREIGVTVNVEHRPANSYWSEVWLKEPSYVSFWNRQHPQTMINLGLISKGKWNESKFADPQFDEQIASAARTTDTNEQRRIYGEALPVFQKRGGWVLPAFGDRLWPVKNELKDVMLDWIDLADLSGAHF
jgi:peptide/nickel transport system substrate-binding protein